MKIETIPQENHQVTITAEIESDRLESAKRRAARRISERKSIPGFRPGKAPYEHVVRYVGEGAIVEEAVDMLLDEVYPQAVKEAGIEPAAPGSLEKIDGLEDNKPVFTFTVPLAPTVDLGKYQSVRLPYDWKEPGEDKVEDAIQELRTMYGKTETVTRPVEKGDFVMIDLKGSKAKAAEGEPPVIDRPGMPIFIRPEAKEDEWPYSGFSTELIGTSPDEVKTFSHKFPKDHADESLKGETIQFEARIKMVRGTTLPELDDEFAKTVGAFANLEALHDAVRANLSAQSKSEYDTDYFNQLVDKIGEGATVKYPPQVLDHETEHVLEDLQGRLAEQKMDLETYFKVRETTREKFIEEEAKPAAIKRMTRSLILDEIVRQEKIEVSQEQLNATFQQTWGEFSYSEDFQKMMRGKTRPPKRLIDAVAMQSANRALTELTLNRLKEIATGQAGEAREEKPKKAASATKKPAAKKPAAKGAEKKSTARPAATKKPAGKPAPKEK